MQHVIRHLFPRLPSENLSNYRLANVQSDSCSICRYCLDLVFNAKVKRDDYNMYVMLSLLSSGLTNLLGTYGKNPNQKINFVVVVVNDLPSQKYDKRKKN